MYFPLVVFSVVGRIMTLVPPPHNLYVGVCRDGEHIDLTLDGHSNDLVTVGAILTITTIVITSIVGVLYIGLAMRLAPSGTFLMVLLEACIIIVLLTSLDEDGCRPGAGLLLSAVVAGGWSIMGLATSQSISEGTVIRESRANIFVEDTKDVMARLIF